jgi:hypothetical protein
MSDIAQLRSRANQLAGANNFGAEAERVHREITALDATDITAMNRLARCLRNRGARDEAIAVYEAVLALDTHNDIAMNGLAALRPKPPTPPPPGKTHHRSPRPALAPSHTDIKIPAEEAVRFRDEMQMERYWQYERGYKRAVHLVVSAVLRRDGRSDGDVLQALSSAFVLAHPDLGKLGLTKKQQAEADSGLTQIGLHDAFANLSDARFTFLQYGWIPKAVELGMGPTIVAELRKLTDPDTPLAARVDRFREEFAGMADHARRSGGHILKSDAKTSSAFTAMLLGGFDPGRYTFYRAGALKNGYELYAPGFAWPTGVTVGERYSEMCAFVAAVADGLRAKDVPVLDLIDAQSFLWLRFRWGPSLHAPSKE